MRYAIIGDIHGNLEALEAVLHDAEGQEADEVLCLGDVVGYGADPEECLVRVTDRCASIVGGNHDFAATGRSSLEYFNPYARRAIEWTTEQLSPGSLKLIDALELTVNVNGFSLVHSSFFAPERFDYVFAPSQARVCFRKQESSLAFFGHTHLPVAFLNTEPVTYSLGPELRINPGVKTLVNVGSVGQPRDEDARACYAVYDTDELLVRIRRVSYDIEQAARKITQAGLPSILAERLFLGR